MKVFNACFWQILNLLSLVYYYNYEGSFLVFFSFLSSGEDWYAALLYFPSLSWLCFSLLGVLLLFWTVIWNNSRTSTTFQRLCLECHECLWVFLQFQWQINKIYVSLGGETLITVTLNSLKPADILWSYLRWNYIFLRCFTGAIWKSMGCILCIVKFYAWDI